MESKSFQRRKASQQGKPIPDFSKEDKTPIKEEIKEEGGDVKSKNTTE